MLIKAETIFKFQISKILKNKIKIESRLVDSYFPTTFTI